MKSRTGRMGTARSAGWVSKRISASPVRTAPYENAFTRKATPGPHHATAAPPSAGPTIREALNWAELSVIPDNICSRGTRSATMACQAGRLSPALTPTKTDMAMNAAADRTPLNHSAAIPTAGNACRNWVASSTLRRW